MDEERPELDFQFYLGVLRRRYPIIVLVTVLAVGVAFARSATSTRIYSTSADVLVLDPSRDTTLSGSAGSTDVGTEIVLMQSAPVTAAVNKKLGARAAEISGISIAPVGSTWLVRVTAESASPNVARAAANAYANKYVEIRGGQSVDSALSAEKVVRNKLNDLQGQLDAVDAQLAGQPLNSNLQDQRSALASQISTYKEDIDKLQVDSALRKGVGAQVVTPAGLPTVPIRPTPVRDGLLGLALGLILGLGFAFLAEFLDDKIKSAADIARYAKGLPTLAEIPTIGRSGDGRRLVALDDPTSGAAETYRSLRTSLRLLALRSPITTLLVTSAMPGEGKTTTVANLGVTMARTGLRVLVVDLDLRRPQLAEFFGGDNERGLTSVLMGEATLEEVLMAVPVAAGVPSMAVLPAGPLPLNPSEVMSTDRVGDLLAQLRDEADLIIIDTPPIVPVTDAVVLSPRVDSVLLIVKAGKTRRRHFSKAVDMLGQADAAIVGAVLNDAGRHVRYGYYPRYGPGHKPGSKASGLSGGVPTLEVQPIASPNGNGNGSGKAVNTGDGRDIQWRSSSMRAPGPRSEDR
jgi:non-specific protein-tyrosine kinase